MYIVISSGVYKGRISLNYSGAYSSMEEAKEKIKMALRLEFGDLSEGKTKEEEIGNLYYMLGYYDERNIQVYKVYDIPEPQHYITVVSGGMWEDYYRYERVFTSKQKAEEVCESALKEDSFGFYDPDDVILYEGKEEDGEIVKGKIIKVYRGMGE